MWSFLPRACLALLPCVLLILELCASASAQESTANQADALFVAGKVKLAEKDYEQACQLFSESFRIEAATGTLLALAICQERAGKLASAFASYNEVVQRSNKEQRPDRAKAASEKAAALQPRLSGLRVVLGSAAGAAGLVVRIDGEPVDAAKLKSTIPMDGGYHAVEVSAPALRTWTETVTLAESGDEKILTAPALRQLKNEPRESRAATQPSAATTPQATEASESSVAAAPPGAPVLPSAAPIPAPERAPERADSTPSSEADSSDGGSSLSALRVTALVAFTAGLVGLAGATVFTLRAVHDNDASRTGCNGNLCTAAARNQRLDARQAGNLATVGFVLGGSLVGAGALMWLLGGHDPSASSAESGHSVRVALTPWFGAHALGAVAQGAF